MKIKRDAFIYLDSKEPYNKFAQCSTCAMWTGPKDKGCLIHDPKVRVTGDMSCNFYVHGNYIPNNDFVGPVTPEESGLVKRSVRCENCKFFDGYDQCMLYSRLNKDEPDIFDLDTQVNKFGCCNANTPKGQATN